jgi:hypothetical protein
MGDEFNINLCKKIREGIDEKINKLFDCDESHEERIKCIEITLSKFENIPETLRGIRDDLKILTMIKPIVEDSAEWITKIKNACVWISITAVGGGLAAIVFKVISNLINL